MQNTASSPAGRPQPARAPVLLPARSAARGEYLIPFGIVPARVFLFALRIADGTVIFSLVFLITRLQAPSFSRENSSHGGSLIVNRDNLKFKEGTDIVDLSAELVVEIACVELERRIVMRRRAFDHTIKTSSSHLVVFIYNSFTPNALISSRHALFMQIAVTSHFAKGLTLRLRASDLSPTGWLSADWELLKTIVTNKMSSQPATLGYLGAVVICKLNAGSYFGGSQRRQRRAGFDLADFKAIGFCKRHYALFRAGAN
ncbi:hypothetical protein EVAR_25130_1 [Eumeta japonica]|uniref:Uncharacterized protein n=1 Tax=Eumeta variegata TaxID=151549 RepID=A0A4C1XP29_EUMVA|nr:hypothetical protein EVAR_25130_1 [Eumeta japonica]